MTARTLTEIYWQRIRTHEALRNYFSDVIGFSLPVPAISANSLSGFYYLVNRLETPTTIQPIICFTGRIPECEITEITTAETIFAGIPNEFTDSPEREPAPRASYSVLYEALQDLLPVYALRQQPRESARIYRDVLYQIEPEYLHPFYTALNPHFFNWLAEA